MCIYTCILCGYSGKNAKSFSKHVTQKHNMAIKDYYDTNFKKEGEGLCIVCESSTPYTHFLYGYRQVCSRSCSAKVFRERLKNDDEKYALFVEKVSQNQREIWKKREETGEKEVIIKKATKTNVKKIAIMTDLEKIKSFSRYYRCDDKTIERLNKKGAEQLMQLRLNQQTGYHKCKKGKFIPKNPEKYKGDVENIIFRSGYELRAMKFFDENDSILEWSSEETVIPYISPLDNRNHRYFPDFLIKVEQKDGTIKTIMIEVKPKVQTQEPKVQSKKTRKYINEVTTWGVNQSKWKYAREYCADRQWDFMILTEEHLGIK